MCRGSVEKKKRSEEKLDVLARCRESIKSKAKRLDRKGCVEIFFEKLSTLKKRSFLREDQEHILTHVLLVMTKTHCTYTCIKSSKEYVCCV